MDTIKVTWYNFDSKQKGVTILSPKYGLTVYSLKDAIDLVRVQENYRVMILKVEYKNPQKLIKSVTPQF